MIRCFSIVRSVRNTSGLCVALQSHKFGQKTRNFSQINPASCTFLFSTHQNNRFQSQNVRFASTNEPIVLLDKIPEPPAIPETPSESVVETLAQGAEPAFSSLGLGGWSPVGMVQSSLEYLHIGLDLPWWTCIMIGTIAVRLIIFPLVIKAQQNGAKMNNHLPQLQILQLKVTEARQSGNALEAARYSQELVAFMKEKNLNPLKNTLVPLAQAPLFISFFIGLRRMANTPVESLKTGGLFWFPDLTIPDPLYLLPIITSCTMLLTIEIGTDGARLNAANMSMMKYIFRALPFIILPFTINFPGAILTYWTFSNFISLGQVGILKIPSVREYFGIEKLLNHKAEDLPGKKKGFREGFKDSWTNMKITRELEERKRLDSMMFQRAARGAVQKTYKYDPTKPRP